LVEDVIDPGKQALAGLRIMLFDEAIDNVVGKSVALDDDEALSLRQRRAGTQKKNYSRKGAKTQNRGNMQEQPTVPAPAYCACRRVAPLRLCGKI
jgi:hypothetical protein